MHNGLIYAWLAVLLISVIMNIVDGWSTSRDNESFAIVRDLSICMLLLVLLTSVMSTLTAFVLYKAVRGVPRLQDDALEEKVSLLVYLENMKAAKQITDTNEGDLSYFDKSGITENRMDYSSSSINDRKSNLGK